MTTEKNEAVPNSFVMSVLPWLVGAIGLLVYLFTLDGWISLLSLGTVARTSGWLWLPELSRPLTAAVLFPFRWLPEAWLPLTLNIFTAIGAGAALFLLARSVALLPYDLTPEDLLRKEKPLSILSLPTAWIPPVFGAAVCGFQLSFWENATSATGAIVNLLVFAYALRCLLEFRVCQKQSWLSRGVFVYAAGMANNWLLIGFLPVFLAAIVWVKGLEIFTDRRFLLRMLFWGICGLSLYLLLPAAQMFSGPGHLSFWMALKVHLKAQAEALMGLRLPGFRLLALTLLLPVLVFGIRWKSHTAQFGDDTWLGIFLIKATGHFVHAAFFALSLWIALEPMFTPRNLSLGAPLLSYYYLWAMVSGYCAGYFLLLGGRAGKRSPSQTAAAAIGLLLLAFASTLVWRNFWQVRTTNGPAVHEFARELCASLPAGKSVALSEDPTQLLLLRAELAAHGRNKDALLLDTRSLLLPQYHVFMANRFKSRWPEVPPTNRVGIVGSARLLALVEGFAAREPVVYLHPSSGLFFEPFVDQPRGSIHYLAPRPTNNISGEVLADEIITTNEQIWQRCWTNNLRALAKELGKEPKTTSHLNDSPLGAFRLPAGRNFTAAFLGAVYSKSLNYWGVRMQQAGRWKAAGIWFQRALELNPANLAAAINATYNARRQHGAKSRLTVREAREEFPGQFKQRDNWVAVLNEDGPVDEPTFLVQSGRVFLESRNNRQAAGAFARSAELAPDWLAPKLWLAESYIALGSFSNVLVLTKRVEAVGPPQNGRVLAQLLYCRATALRGLGRTNDAADCIDNFVLQQGKHNEVLSVAATLYAANAEFGREISVLDELLKRKPNEPQLLKRKGRAELRLKKYDDAIALLTTALSLSPSDDDARLFRAIACLGAGKLDSARKDYDELLTRSDNSQAALFGLGGIAWREHDTNEIMQYYKQYLSNAVPRSLQYEIATERLRDIGEDPLR